MNKNNITLIILLIVLLAVLLIIRYVTDPSEKRIQFFNVNQENIYSIEIFSRDDSLRVVRTDNEWLIEKPFVFPLDMRRMDSFMSQVMPVQTSTTPVSISEESHSEYQITDERGTTVSFYDANNNLLDRAIIGRSGRMAFGRRPGDKNVYQLTENVSFLITANVAPWRQNSVIALTRSQINSVKVQYEFNTYTITATDSLWHFQDSENSFPIRDTNTALRNIFTQLENFTSLGYLDYEFDEYEHLFAKPEVIITITRTNNMVNTYKFGFDIEDGNFIVMKDNNQDHMYLVDADIVDNFTKAYQHFELTN